MITQTQTPVSTTSQRLGFVLILTTGFFGFGIALLFLIAIHDTLVQYNSEVKWFILLIATLLVFILLLFVGGHTHLSLKRKHLELLAYEQNNLLPRSRKPVTIEQKTENFF